MYASTWLLPDTLQHSILGSWLTATQVGVSPTCLQLISSTHVHVLVIPKKPIVSLDAATEEDLQLLGHLQWVIRQVARELNIHETGYRVVTNCGSDGGQSVYHIHYHLLGGRPLSWPPG